MARNSKMNVTIGGKSLFFNVLFVLLNLAGLTLLTIGFHDSFAEKGLLFKLSGIVLILFSIVLLIIFQGRLLFANISRVLLGGLFIVSGLVKANDPYGFAYKLEEYFEDGALAYRIKEWFHAPSFTLEYLIDYALAISVIICIIEIVLGVLLIIGGKMRIVSIITVLMMAFFTFLTAHTATCDSDIKFKDRDTYSLTDEIAVTKMAQAKDNKNIKIISKTNTSVTIDEMRSPQCVDDCGCFGDAMKGSVGRSLTPKETLWKDIIVLYLSIWILATSGLIKPNSRKENAIYTVTSMLVILFFSAIFSWYFPLIFGLVAVLGALWVLRVGGNIFGNYFGVTLFVTLISWLFAFFVLRYEPMKDYRPYAVGSNLKENMNNGEEGIYQNKLRYVNKKTGEERLYDASSKEFMDSKIWEDENWEYKDGVQVVIKATKLPSITEQFNPFILISELTTPERNMDVLKEFLKDKQVQVVKVKNLSSNDIYDVPLEEFTIEEYTPEYYAVLDTVYQVDEDVIEFSIRDYSVEVDQIIMITSKNIMTANWESIDKYKKIFEYATQNNIPMVLVTSTSRDKINDFRKKYKFDIPVFNNDEIELKAIARSNPSMMIIQKGIVEGKFSHRSTPTVDWLKKNILIEKE